MIKSIKLANSYPTSEVGFVAKDLSGIYNFEFNTNFSIVILNSFFETLLKDNTVKNRIDSLLQNINEKTNANQIKEISETIIDAIQGCDFSEKLKENLDDAYETLPWKSSVSAKDLLNSPEYKINLIGSTNYVTAPLMLLGIEKKFLEEKIKEVYAHYFSVEEITYRINSDIDQKFSIAIVIQKEEQISASALCYIEKIRQNENIAKIFVFPGLINIKDIEKPDEEIKPDQYIIDKDTLSLRSSIAGKQKFKNASENGKYKRVECQINNFILNDAIASEIARLTKKASILLEKKVQIIFTITNNKINVMHVSNTIDLQKDYFDKTEIKIDFASGKAEETIDVDEEPEETILKEDYEKENNSETEKLDRIEPNTDKIPNDSEGLESKEEEIEKIPDEPKTSIGDNTTENPENTTDNYSQKSLEDNNEMQELAQEQEEETNINNSESVIQEITGTTDNILNSNKHKNTSISGNQNLDTTTSNSILDLNSDKPLNELMQSSDDNKETETQDETQQIESQEQESFNQNIEPNKELTEEEQKEWIQEPIQGESNIANSEPISLLDEPEVKAESILWNEEPNKYNNKNIIDKSDNLLTPKEPKGKKKSDERGKQEDNDDFLI